MTLFVHRNPRPEVKEILNAGSAWWPTATVTTVYPTTAISAPVIQHAYDGSPSQQANRSLDTIRVTCWTPKGQVDASINLARLVAAYLLDSGSSDVWRFRNPVGFNQDIDARNTLPFCTFTITAETRPEAVPAP